MRIGIFLKKVGKTIESIYLCARFPFLYPRNRFTDLHHTYWRWHKWVRELYVKYSRFVTTEKTPADTGRFYETITGGFSLYWINWWAKPVHDAMAWMERTILQIPFLIPTYTELDGMEKGWRKSFGIQMCEEIKRALKKTDSLWRYRILQIKEKNGGLRWYDNGANVEVEKIVAKYEYISERTCGVCGDVATCVTPMEYWKYPYCDKHSPSESRYLLDYGIDGRDWYGLSGNINWRSEEEFEKRKIMSKEYEELVAKC